MGQEAAAGIQVRDHGRLDQDGACRCEKQSWIILNMDPTGFAMGYVPMSFCCPTNKPQSSFKQSESLHYFSWFLQLRIWGWVRPGGLAWGLACGCRQWLELGWQGGGCGDCLGVFPLLRSSHGLSLWAVWPRWASSQHGGPEPEGRGPSKPSRSHIAFSDLPRKPQSIAFANPSLSSFKKRNTGEASAACRLECVGWEILLWLSLENATCHRLKKQNPGAVTG